MKAEVRDDVKEIRRDIKSLVDRQSEMEHFSMSVAEKVLVNCGKK